jgi:hypothetical protein
MTKYKVVVRFKDKTLLKGTISNFSPFFLSLFQLELLNGEDKLSWVGDKIALQFEDGERMVGYTQHLDYSTKGYFITPADVNGNNTYVFASKSAIDNMSFL